MTTNATKINIVLVHGIWFDASSWSKVISILQNVGHRVIAVHLSLYSLTDDDAIVKRAIELLGGPTILVGHAYGGFDHLYILVIFESEVIYQAMYPGMSGCLGYKSMQIL